MEVGIFANVDAGGVGDSPVVAEVEAVAAVGGEDTDRDAVFF